MPNARQEFQSEPRTFVFDALSCESVSVATLTGTVANTTVQGYFCLPQTVKVIKVGVAFSQLSVAGNPAFNIVYNTVQNISAGTVAAYTTTNVAPPDNSYSGGITTTTPGASITTPGYPNPALTTAYPNFQQVGGLGVPTNVAVDGQPLFNGDVVLNTTNFPGSGASGGFGIVTPTNWDAVYPAGVYPYGVQQGLPNAANLPAVFTLRASVATGDVVTGLKVTLFFTPILPFKTPTAASTYTSNIPGTTF